MTITHPRFEDWIQSTASLVSSMDDVVQFPEILVGALDSVCPCSWIYVGGFGRHRYLATLYADPRVPAEVLKGDDYASGSYLLDPFYQLYRDRQSGCFALHEIAPEGFKETEYYKRYYSKFGMVDELIHLTVVGDVGAVTFGVVRTVDLGPFTRDEIALHKAVTPFVAACCERLSGLLATHSEEDRPYEVSAEGAVERFCAGVLTPREQEVIGLVLRGHNTQSAAVQLGISADTIKLHRKHAYAKFKINSQGELFSKFLESLGMDVSRL